MSTGPQVESDRLLLRRWRESDLEPFAAMNADPEVMEYFPTLLDRARSDALADMADRGFDEDGYGLWAVQVKGGPDFVGFVGLRSLLHDELSFGDAEVGWRLAREAWGKGYATEAARASLDFGFAERRLEEIVSFTSVRNERSRRVMERLGMRRDPSEDFDHPRIEPGHVLRRHVLYRLSRREWLGGQASSRRRSSSDPSPTTSSSSSSP